jgi:hypothetical protein
VRGLGLGAALPRPAHASADGTVIAVVAFATGLVVADLTFARSPGFVVGGVF